jgi:hypothetical protein
MPEKEQHVRNIKMTRERIKKKSIANQLQILSYLERMMWSRSRKAKDVAIHGCHNKIKIISTINIICQDHAISVMERCTIT